MLDSSSHIIIMSQRYVKELGLDITRELPLSLRNVSSRAVEAFETHKAVIRAKDSYSEER